MITEWVPESARIELRGARVAAETARGVPGVARLQPRLWGLVRQLAREAWQRVGGEERPDVAGVHAELTALGSMDVEVYLVVAPGHQATRVCETTQREVTASLHGCALDCTVGAVRVHVVDVLLA